MNHNQSGLMGGVAIAIGVVISILLLPMILLNWGAGLVGGAWLLFTGDWQIIVYGVVVSLLGPIAIGIVMLPGVIFIVPAVAALSTGRIAIGRFLMLWGTLWTNSVWVGWVLLPFMAVLHASNFGFTWPVSLWCFAIATGPLMYLASKEQGDWSIPQTLAIMAADCLGVVLIIYGLFGLPAELVIASTAAAVLVPTLATQLMPLRDVFPTRPSGPHLEPDWCRQAA